MRFLFSNLRKLDIIITYWIKTPINYNIIKIGKTMFETPAQTHKLLSKKNLKITFKREDKRKRVIEHNAAEYVEAQLQQNKATFKPRGQVIVAEEGCGVRSFNKDRLIEVKDLDTKEVLFKA